ncbi:uncharacterized protein LOC143005741 isoform X2 [Genypterus blacodes]|uniref:uncharacterized protein LOC143005741 isoform X2 n=1 Tax=Genypterus blacodes TaxID=154954 RepID=UPI003F7580AD
MKLNGFCAIFVKLSLVLCHLNADCGIQRLFDSSTGNRPFVQLIASRFVLFSTQPDPEEGGLCTCNPSVCTVSKNMCLINTNADLNLPKPLISTKLQEQAVSNTEYIRFSPPSPGFHETKYNHQFIVVMEQEAVTMEAGTSLYERHPTISTLLMYQKGKLHDLRGRPSYLLGDCDVILVGHGSKDRNGLSQLAGYGPEELAKIMAGIENKLGQIHSISLISCNLGNDVHFIMRLLQALRSLKMEAKLNLHNSMLAVSPDGEMLTTHDGVWRSHDHSKRLVAELDIIGNLLTRGELGCKGQVFPNYKGKALYYQTLDWPSHPQMFVPMELRKKYPSIDCLEGLTWSLFFEDGERRRAPDYVPELHQQHLSAVWLIEQGPNTESVVFKHITNIQDLLVEIRYNAREEPASDLHYVLNYCIYKVHSTNLSVSLVGRFMNIDNQAEADNFLDSFSDQKDVSSLSELRQGLKPSSFNDFCRQTFQLQHCTYNCERWGHYFMAAVFSASVRNFRTFSLFLMSVIGCEVGRTRGTDSTLCTAFVGDDHPMVNDQPWPEHLRRGFYGCTVGDYEMAPHDMQIWLDQVIAKENALYVKSKQIMNDVDRDEQTELDIFGRVKVMNSYVFSSYLEFFRGTPEGKKLKRGCTLFL